MTGDPGSMQKVGKVGSMTVGSLCVSQHDATQLYVASKIGFLKSEVFGAL